MRIEELAELIQDEPVFASSLLKVAGIKTSQVEIQLVRWVKSGYLLKLRRGVYTFAEPYRKIEPHPFLIANHLQRGSYVSFQSALAYYDLIPEHVPVVTSATTGRPETVKTLHRLMWTTFAGGKPLKGVEEATL